MTPTPEIMDLARKCAAKYWQTGATSDELAAAKILSGEWDDQAYTQAALTAIIEASEMAAQLCDNEDAAFSAVGIRNGEHLR